MPTAGGNKRVLAGVILGALLLTVVGLYLWLRHGTPTVVAYLPDTETLAYVNLVPLRSAGIFSGAPEQRSPAYADFVQQSGFDFERDLDAVGLALVGSPADPTSSTALAAGRFGADFQTYLAAHALAQSSFGQREIYDFAGWARPEQHVSAMLLSSNLLALTNGPPATLRAIATAYDHWQRPPAPPTWQALVASGRPPLAAIAMDTARLAAAHQLGPWTYALRGTQSIVASVSAGVEGADLRVEADCASSADAQQLTAWTTQQIHGLTQALDAAPTPASADTSPTLASLLHRLAISQSDAHAQLQLQLTYKELRAWVTTLQ